MRGLFLTIEGGEGAGKSTLIKGLMKALRKQGHSLIQTREPGGTALGRRLRKELLRGEAVNSVTELLLYAADRAHHVSTVIRPSVRAGSIVICDRFSDSTMAYQGYGRKLDKAHIAALMGQAEQGLRPDLTFWLDIPPKEGLARVRTRGRSGDRLEKEALAFHTRVRTGFRAIAKAEPDRVIRIDAKKGPDEILEAVMEHLAKRFPRRFHAL